MTYLEGAKQAGLSVLFVSIRIALTTDWLRLLNEKGLGFKDYRNDIKAPRLICQLDSLHKVNRNFDIVVIDEIQTALERFATPDLKRGNRENLAG